ncbi:MAG TPA: hypothetical protein ENH99_00725 [Candidatus Pacearchaeota archaeon]|nr:hypothetical protein [Candidatus Pacearchaeota archaeon]
MLKNKKHVFWQAFFLTLLFFFLGIVLGIYLEQTRADDVNIAFYKSEASLYDSLALGRLIEDASVSCQDFQEASVEFADRIFEEARELEQFDESNKLTGSVKIIHRKYDLLRTLLWMNLISAKETCESEINTIVYLYTYDTNEVSIKSEQTVWSRVLSDLKEEEGNEIILIPIAIDQDVSSLKYLIKRYGVEEFPAVVINEKHIINELISSEELREYLD